MRRVVVAIGGNALLRPGDSGAPVDLALRASEVAGSLVPLVRAGLQVLIVHGNGPQVGIELVRSEEASTKVAPFTLGLCVASTQGSMAALLEVALRNALHEEGLSDVPIASVLSLVEVDENDPAFKRPTKPIGLFYSAYRARQVRDELIARGWDIKEDAGRGFRPVVPSPNPLRIPSAPLVRTLLDAGALVIAGGGGGVPITRSSDGRIRGVEAVIDKDRTTVLLASAVDADAIIFLTGVPWIELNYQTPFAKHVETLTVSEAAHHLRHGQFPAGSMGPKVEAALDFAGRCGGTTIITSAEALADAIAGRSGTRIVPDPPMPSVASAHEDPDD